MRLLAIIAVLLAPAGVGAQALAPSVGLRVASPPPPAGPAPVYWQQEVFVIPYQWSARTDPQNAGEVILYLSTDRGATWNEVTRGTPDVQSFRYQAPRDGEYWFAVRTLDRRGRMWPTGGFTPELSVVVDTQLPKLSVRGTIDPSGRLVAKCLASDANIDPASLMLRAVVDGVPSEVPLQVANQRATTGGAPGGTASGGVEATASWQAPEGARNVTLEFAARDLAGNPAGAGAIAERVAAQQAAAPGPELFIRSSSALPAAPATPGVPSDPFLAAPPLEVPSADAWRSTEQPVAAPPKPTGEVWTADRIASAPFSAGALAAGDPLLAAPAPMVAQRARPLPASAAASSPYSAPLPSPFSTPFSTASTARRSPSTQTAPAPGGPDPSTPSAEGVQFVNQPRFALAYDLESAGDWGVSSVEVWGTTDDGQTWRRFADDSDNRSPVNITTPGPGRYGFRIVVQGVGSLPMPAPEPGDQPEILVEVDTEPPAALFTSIGQGSGYAADQLQIAWQATDRFLAPRPVTLSYSSRPSGPWISLAADVPNLGPGAPAGRYAWRLQRHLPEQLYLRMKVRDLAGNVTTVDTPQPITLRLSQPSGRLLNAQPVGY